MFAAKLCLRDGGGSITAKLTFDADLACKKLAKADPKLKSLIRQVGGYTVQPERGVSTYHALMRSIVYQQLSGAAAATIFRRLCELWTDDGSRPSPDQILEAGETKLRSAGLSRAKTLALQDLAAREAEGLIPSVRKLGSMDDEAIIDVLTEVRGIGRWTVEMLLIFRLGRPDVLPVHDLGVRKGFSLAYGLSELPTPAELTEHAEIWKPFRSVGSWYMWRAVEAYS